jgi:predicted alpha/beta superfamily hydrolase
MHDGQNLFDQNTSYSGEWEVDETMEKLAKDDLEAIVVGIPNMGIHRLAEYSPFHDLYHGQGRGDRYIAFICDTLKPLIDQDFRTRPEPENTGILGSSMGGLISLYAFFHRPDTFGLVGSMSPSVWYADLEIFNYVRRASKNPGKIYLDVGTREYGGMTTKDAKQRSRRYYARVRRLKRILVRKGYRPIRELLHVEEKLAGHNEPAWSRRLPIALRFLLLDHIQPEITE